MEHPNNYSEEKICVVIPAFQVAPHIHEVIQNIPEWVWKIVVVDDASTDDTAALVSATPDARLILLRHEHNQGVGGAMLTGFAHAREQGASILVKIDGDNQMPLEYLPALLQPILEGRADYTKGNRFVHLQDIQKMPAVRRFGNLSLSFLTKMASGYWNIFDPTNGYLAMDAELLNGLDTTHVHPRYFFESSMLIELNLMRAVVADVPIPARYLDETSSLSIFRALVEFPWLLVKGFLRRLWLQYFVLEFSAGSLFLIAGILMCLFGAIWGSYKWWLSIATNIAATTGTVMIAAMPVILGFQLLLQTVVLDIQRVPTQVRSRKGAARQRR